MTSNQRCWSGLHEHGCAIMWQCTLLFTKYSLVRGNKTIFRYVSWFGITCGNMKIIVGAHVKIFFHSSHYAYLPYPVSWFSRWGTYLHVEAGENTVQIIPGGLQQTLFIHTKLRLSKPHWARHFWREQQAANVCATQLFSTKLTASYSGITRFHPVLQAYNSYHDPTTDSLRPKQIP